MRRATVAVVAVVAVLYALLGGEDAASPPAEPPKDEPAAVAPTPPPVVPGDPDATGTPEMAGGETGSAEDDPESLLLRFVHDLTGKPITDLTGLVLSWDGRRKGRRGALPHEDGWFRLPRISASGEIELGLPGFTRATVDLLEAKGRVELRLGLHLPNAGGIIVVPKGSEVGPVEVSIRPVEVDRRLPEFQVIGLPERAGDIELYYLPDGRYEIEVTSVVDGVCVRAKKTLHRVGPRITGIGKIELVRWAGIRARVVDLDGRLVPQARVVIVREEENEKRGRVIEPDQRGWVTFADFEPGAWHRVYASGLPGPLDRLVLAPEKKGGLVTVELTWPGRLTTCVLRFKDGDEILDAIALLNSRGPVALRKEHVTGKQTITVELLPGEYAWKWGPHPGGGPPIDMEARFVVPPQRRFESVVRIRNLLLKD